MSADKKRRLSVTIMDNLILTGQKNKKLAGHRAVITGASSGIGEQYARQLGAMGSDLVIVARRIDKLEALANELRKKHRIKVDAIELDLSKPNAALTLFEKSTDQNASVTILINNAGVGKYGPFMEFSLQDHLSTAHINSVVPTELTYRFASHMLLHKRKSYISQVASIASFQPVGYFTVYSASKGYLRYFTESLAFELRKSNISISCTCPGGTYTEFLEQAGQKLTSSGHRTMMTAEDVVRASIQAMLNEKTVFVPGILNKLACFFPRFLPRGLSIFLGSKALTNSADRAPIREKGQPIKI